MSFEATLIHLPLAVLLRSGMDVGGEDSATKVQQRESSESCQALLLMLISDLTLDLMCVLQALDRIL